MNKEQLLNNLHKLYRSDPWLMQIFTSTGLTLDELETEINRVERQYWFDTIDIDFLPIYEKLLAIKTNPSSAIEDRRSFIEAKWKSSSKCDLKLIQAVCNSWKNGEVTTAFINGQIQLKFIGDKGVPEDLQGLLLALDGIKPAHLALTYIFAYYLVEDINNMLIEDLITKKIEEFAFNPR